MQTGADIIGQFRTARTNLFYRATGLDRLDYKELDTLAPIHGLFLE